MIRVYHTHLHVKRVESFELKNMDCFWYQSDTHLNRLKETRSSCHISKIEHIPKTNAVMWIVEHKIHRHFIFQKARSEKKNL